MPRRRGTLSQDAEQLQEPERAGSEPARELLAGAAIWAGLGVLGCALVRGLEPSLLEEGYLVHFAERMARGEVLYRDLVTFTGPLPFELLALVFRASGPSVDAARWSIALVAGLGTASAFVLGRRAGAGPFAHLAAAFVAAAPVVLFPLLGVYFYSTLGLHLALAAGAAAALDRRSIGCAVAAGVLLAGVALCKQTVGAALAPLLFGAIWLASPRSSRDRRALALLLGSLGVTFATLLAPLLRGDLAAWVDCLVWIPLSLEPGFDSPLPNWWPPARFAPEIAERQSFYLPHLHLLLGGDGSDPAPFFVLLSQLAFAAPFASLLLVPLVRVRGPLPGAVWIQAALVTALSVHLFPRADWGHLVFALPAAVLLASTLLGVALGGRGALPAGIAAAALGAAAWLGAGALAARSGEPVLGERVRQRPVSPMYKGDALPRVVAFLRDRTRPGDPVFVARAEPLLYYATETRNPTPYGGVIPAFRERQQRVILEALADVRYVVMSDLDRPVFNYYRDELPEVQQHLERHFRVATPFEGRRARWIGVLERGPDRGPSHADLYERLGESRAWVRREGVEAPGPVPGRLAVQQNRRPVPIALGQDGGGIDYELRLPEGAFFQAALGVVVTTQGSTPVRHAMPAEWVLAVRMPDAPDFEVLYRRPVRPAFGWTDVEVDLGAFAGREVVLRLAVESRHPLPEGALGWWGSPRIVTRPAPR